VTVTNASIEQDYLAAQASFLALVAELADDDWATGVPCCPGWTVRDVLSHVAGIPDDVLAGRLDGVATEPWTAAQVERNRSLSVPDLLARWNEQTPGFAAAMQAMRQDRPPIDCHAHEHDVRQALNRPGTRDHRIVATAVAGMLDGWDGPAPLIVEFVDGSIAGNVADTSAVVLSDVTPFEIFRSRLGRRSRAQVESYGWSGEPDQIASVIDHWFSFGPATTPIIE
jgi:Mycothiol maleylpyruvate isomerase N-terminal domain